MAVGAKYFTPEIDTSETIEDSPWHFPTTFQALSNIISPFRRISKGLPLFQWTSLELYKIIVIVHNDNINTNNNNDSNSKIMIMIIIVIMIILAINVMLGVVYTRSP